MPFEVKIIEDSIFEGSRLTTFQLKYPRFIHSEFMTHRVFSRNASSSRAIPVERMIEQVLTDPAMPVHWGKNQSGMQAHEELDPLIKAQTKQDWLAAAESAANRAEKMNVNNVHKQVVNRILEPFQWISVVCTATEYQNFFELRCHADAQPEIKVLADMMYDEYHRGSCPNELTTTEFHLPYVSHLEKSTYSNEDCVKFSVARCARVSYLTHDGENPSPDKDISLYERLVGSRPLHASPAEHQARPYRWHQHGIGENELNGNFNGYWTQFRKLLEQGKEREFFQ